MTDRTPCVGPEEIGVLMDLLSHDILNNNQATLSYLELIHTSKVDGRTKELSEKAATQVRTSSVLLDGIRRFVTSSRGGALPTAPVDLRETVLQVATEASELFPHKRVTIDTSKLPPGTGVRGAQCVKDLFSNLVINLVQLDPGDSAKLEVEARVEGCGRSALVKVKVASATVTLPKGVGDSLFTHARAKDLSKMARVSGAVFAGSVARGLGGGMTSHFLDPGRKRGCVFEITLKGAGAE